jgi:tetratricopeptide (TPR) repeat protein
LLPGFIAMLLAVGGCGKRDSDATIEELARRKRSREQSVAPNLSLEPQLVEVEKLLDGGNVAVAELKLKPLLVAYPRDATVKFLVARCAAIRGESTLALELLEEIDDADMRLKQRALSLAVDTSLAANDFGAAERNLLQLAETPGQANRARRQLARLLTQRGRQFEAASLLRQLAHSGNIREQELFALITVSDLFVDESQPKPSGSGELTESMLAFAKRLRSDGDLAGALQYADRLAEAFPSSTAIAAFAIRLSAELLDETRFRERLSSLPTGIENEPEYWASLGKWLQSEGRHREAIRCLLEAVRLDPTDRVSYALLARSAATVHPSLSAAAIQRASLLEETADIAKRIGKQPGTPEELERLAILLDELQRPWEALAWRQVSLKTHGGTAKEFNVLNKQRDALENRDARENAEDNETSRELFVTCGVDRSQWPLPQWPQETLNERPIDSVKPAPTPESNSGTIALSDVANEVDLAFQYVSGGDLKSDSVLLHQTTGGGIGVIDIDLDGWPDLCFAQGGGDAFDPAGSLPNRLFRNLEGQRFIDVSDTSGIGDRGYSQGITIADINQDGFPDLLVANIGPNTLFLNNGDGTFQAHSLAIAGMSDQWTMSIACGDLSGDSLPEIVEVNYIDDASVLKIACTAQNDACSPNHFRSAIDRVLQVREDGRIDVWDGCEAISEKPNYGFAAVIANVDDQHGNDLFIANDVGFNHLWMSHAGEDRASLFTLHESAQIFGAAAGLLGQRQGCMGVASGDFDRDGRLDLHVTNFWNQSSDLYLWKGTGLFENEAAKRGLLEATRMTVAWGTQAADFDHDGWLDLVVMNGHLTDHRTRGEPLEMLPQLFQGGPVSFRLLQPEASSQSYWGKPALGRTLALLDWNRDGKVDAVSNHLDAPVALLENKTQAQNGLMIDLVGVKSERDATGAKVTLVSGDQSWTAWNTGGDGFLCTNESVLSFGIGTADAIDEVIIDWPSGERQRLAGLAPNKRYLIIEGSDDLSNAVGTSDRIR